MRRYIIGLAVFAIVGMGSYAVFDRYSTTNLAPHRRNLRPVARAALRGRPERDPARNDRRNFRSRDVGGVPIRLRDEAQIQGCGLLAQPGAQPGKLAQCPVSGVVFVVDPSRPHVRIEGNDFVACCGNCAAKLQGSWAIT
jgi:hypothetical protein